MFLDNLLTSFFYLSGVRIFVYTSFILGNNPRSWPTKSINILYNT